MLHFLHLVIETALSYLIDCELNFAVFDLHHCNDDNGSPAYDSRLLLKIVIIAYSKGPPRTCLG